MRDFLMAKINAAGERRAAMSQELKTALSFAHLEVRELGAGIRELTDCPGIEQVAAAIAKAKGG